MPANKIIPIGHNKVDFAQSQGVLSNIYLDFINPESRRIFGLYSDLSRQKHIDFLVEALTLAVFLCRSYCIVPPGVFLECGLAHAAMESRADYFFERLVRMPIRENDIEPFLAKRKEEWGPYDFYYPDLFKGNFAELLRKNRQAFIKKTTPSGITIAQNWEQAPDICTTGVRWFHGMSAKDIDIVRRIPYFLVQDELAVNWPAFEQRLRSFGIAHNYAVFHDALQHYYFKLSLVEYELRILDSLPYMFTNFGLGGLDLCYDYEALREALLASGVWKVVRSLSAESMCRLRSMSGFFSYRAAFDSASKACSNPRDVGGIFASAYTHCRKQISETKISDRPDSSVPGRGLVLSDSELDALEQRLAALASWISKHVLQTQDYSNHDPALSLPSANRIEISSPEVPNDFTIVNFLAASYSNPTSAKAIWDNAGGNPSDIICGISPNDLWNDLWNRAKRGSGATPLRLLDLAQVDYPNSSVLAREISFYR